MAFRIDATGSRMSRAKAILLAQGALLSIALVPTHAQAQAAPAPATPPVATATDDAPARAEGDIIVTAQRREQRLQDVPIAVSAFSGTTLANSGIKSSADLTQVTPGLNFTQTANFAQPTIRGVGTFNTHVGDEPNVATYIDGVYISQMLGSFFELANIERIEVSKGPQGTLFGRNATGGAINVTTRAPSFTPTYNAEISYGRFNDVRTTAYLSTGLSKGIATSISGFYDHRDGYFTNLSQGGAKEGERESYAIRAKLLVDAAPNLKFTLIGDVSRQSDPIGLLGATINRNSAAEGVGINTTISGRDYQVDLPSSPFNVVKQQGVSLQGDLELGLFDVVSVSAYRRTEQHSGVDSDSTRAPFLYFNQNSLITDYMQELRLVSKPASKIQWILGGFAYKSIARYDPLIVRGQAGGTPIFSLDTKENTLALAAFADVTVPLTHQLSITGGVRYSNEQKEFSFARTPALAAPPNGARPDVSFDSWTPRAVLSFKPSSSYLFYASYSKGFKTGGYNTSAPQDGAYRPETLQAYEIGAKTTLAPGVTFNIAGYHYDYKDLQVQSLTAGGTASISNAATARMNGVDAELSARLFKGFNARVGAAYLDAKYASYPNAPIVIPRTTAVPGFGNRNCVDARAGGGVNECDASGLQVARAPKFTVNAGFTYSTALGGGYTLLASGNVFHSSSSPWEVSGRLRQPTYELVNGQLEFGLPGGNVSIAVFGKNLTDARYYSYVAVSTLGDRGQFADPTTYGFSLKMKY